MADIFIEQKKSRGWMWVVGIVVLALLVWGAYELFDDDRDSVAPSTVGAMTTDAPAPGAAPLMVYLTAA